MKRDFSQEKIEELWDYVNDYMSDYLKDLGKIVDLEEPDIGEAVVCTKAIRNFQEKLEEKEILSVTKLAEIIKNVKVVDETFGRYLKTLNEQLDAYDKRLQLVTEMLKPEKLSMNNIAYLNEILAIGKEYQNNKENSELIKVEIWLNPNYRMSEEELVIAQEMLDEYFAEGTDASNLTRDQRYGIELRDRWGPADWEKFELMSSLQSKVGSYESFMVGITEAIPFSGAFFDWSGELHAEILGYEFNELCYSDNVFANSHTQHPYITFGGNITGSLVTYNIAAGVAGSIPGLSRRISNLSGRLSTFPVLRWIGQDHLTNVIGGTIIETGISTVPGMITDIRSGESVDNVFRNAGLDIGRNLSFNIGGEAISGAVGAVLKRVTAGGKKILTEAVEESMDDVAETALKSGSKNVNTLTDAQMSRLNSLENTINDHLTEGDFSGTLRDLQGDPVPNGKGGYFDHLGEMKDSYSSLKKIKKGLEGSLKNPNLSDVDRALLQEGLDKANSYIKRIQELFKPYGGIE